MLQDHDPGPAGDLTSPDPSGLSELTDTEMAGPPAGSDVYPAENAVATWIFLNPGGKYSLPHLYDGDPVEVVFRHDHTTPGGASWRDRLVTAVRSCCPSEKRRLVDFDDDEFDVFTVPPLVAAWLEWLTDDGSYGIATLTDYEGVARVVP